MVYLKSVLAGIVAMILAEVIVVAGGIALLLIIARRAATGERSLGWDPVSFARTAPGWIILALAFVAGFWWQYRKIAAR